MAEHVIRLPDVGEGVAEAELVEWHVKVGDLVREDTLLGAVMTDKATVEVPSPVEGEVVWLGAQVGDVVAVGSELVRLRVAGEGGATAAKAAPEPIADGIDQSPNGAASEAARHAAPPEPLPEVAPAQDVESPRSRVSPPASIRAAPSGAGGPRPEREKPLASPAVRQRAREAGADLRQVPGTGPAARITHDDLDNFLARGPGGAGQSGLQPKTAVEDIKLVGLRRRIAEKMSLAHEHIPHITYVEEVDVTNLEELRATLNQDKRDEQPRLTILPFLIRAMVRAVAEQPRLNALYDDEAGVLHQHAGIHIGVATQTPSGLMVPVVSHAEALDLWGCAAELTRVSEAARAGLATRNELTGSTITLTSLGAMGGVVTTPIINHPEVAIVGVNKIAVRPVWNGSTFIPRKMMNLSSSFDHRVVDGWDAAVFVQRIKTLLETPALIFIEGAKR
jgi:2-oxoisovalerate dehydrogenase E2 component (dihydrolipoyl transacylase)